MATAEVSVRFRGNHNLSGRTLQRLTANARWDSRGDSRILEAVQEAYIRRGFLLARVRFDRSEADSTIVLHIDEGERVRVAGVRVDGARHRDPPTVRAALGLTEGAVFRSDDLDQALRRLLDDYDRDGYPFAQVWIDSLTLHPETARVSMVINVVEGQPKQLSSIAIEGLTQTREDLVVRLTGLRPGMPYDGGDVEAAYFRLTSSGIFEDVAYPEIRVDQGGQGVEALIQVVETRKRNSFSFALGYADREEEEDAVISGQVLLDVNNIGGSLRDLSVYWRNDGADRSETRITFRQRFLFGYPLNAGLTLEQIGLDTLYTWQSLGVEASAPIGRIHGGIVGADFAVYGDRNTFSVGDVSKSLRLRLQGGLSLEMGRRDRGNYFKIRARGSYASKSIEDRDGGAERTLSQYIVEGDLYAAAEPFSRVHVTSGLHVKNLSSDEELVPLSEQFYIGGAATLRGYRENQFHSRRVGYNRNEILVGRSRLEHGYVFLDVGYFRDESQLPLGGTASSDEFRIGHGFGIRTSSPAGRIDVSFGLGEKFSLQQTKVHVILDRSF
jgi:translocation and assembly module TamA